MPCPTLDALPYPRCPINLHKEIVDANIYDFLCALCFCHFLSLEMASAGYCVVHSRVSFKNNKTQHFASIITTLKTSRSVTVTATTCEEYISCTSANLCIRARMCLR